MQITQSAPSSCNSSAGCDEPDVIVEQIQGEEASPYIKPGTPIRLDPCDSIRGGGGQYFVELDGHKMLQTVQRKPGGRLRLASRNDDYEDTCIVDDEEEGWMTPRGHSVDFKVIGRYVECVDSWQPAQR